MSDNQTPQQAAPNWIGLARDAYEASNNYFDASVRSQVENDLRQFQSMHPQGSKYVLDTSKGRSKLFRPKTRAVIRKNEAAAAVAFFSTNDVVSITPENDNDPMQRASAAVMKEILQFRLTKTLPWFLILVGAYQDAQAVGVVASYQFWNYNPKKKKDEPGVRLIAVENLRFDPAADWTDPINTSPYVIEMIPMYVGKVKARMRNVDPKTGAPKWRTLEDSVIMSATRGYTDSIRQQREANRVDSKDQRQSNNDYNIVWVHKNIIEVDEVDYVYYTLGTEHMLSDPVPLEQVYFHGRRPYVLGCAVLETHKVYPSSVPRLTKDTQAEINEVANQRIDNVKLVLNKRYFAKRNKQVDLRSLTKNVAGSVTLMQDTDDVKTVDFTDVTASSYKEQEVLNLDFDDIAGAFSGSSVQSNRKLNETVGGMELLDAGANQVSGYQLRTFVETWVEPVLRQLVLLEQYYETDETLLGLCGEAAKIVQKFGIDTVTDAMLMQEFTLNVSIGIGATNPAQQVEQFIMGMRSLRDLLADGVLKNEGLRVDEVIKELFGKLGYKDGTRFFETDEQNPMIGQLKQQIAQLQAALDAKTPPELLEAQVRKIDAEIDALRTRNKKENALAVKTGVEAAFSAMQAGEVIAAVPAVAPIADEVMKSAGYTMPTPAGVDPNFPQPAAPAPGLGIDEVWNRKTGISFMPGVNTMPAAGPQAFEPTTAGVGVRQGIQTPAGDSVGTQTRTMANGGLIASYADDLLRQGLIPGLDQDENMALQLNSTPAARPTPAAAPMAAADPSAAAIRAQNARLWSDAPADIGLTINGFTDQTNAELGIKGYADGGLIVGPGTGTSDSIAAEANGKAFAVSNEEYVIPPHVVAAFGQDFFDNLIAQFHTPVAGPNGPMPQSDAPLPLEDGAFIIPQDVVAALGVDFFDRLITMAGQ